MEFTIIYTIILALSTIILAATSASRLTPKGMRVLPVIAIALVWLVRFLDESNGPGGIPATIVLVLFYFITYVIVIPTVLGALLMSFLDRERSDKPETIGDPSRTKKLCIVMHPGVTDLTITCARTCALKLVENGFSVTIATANRNLAVAMKNYKALLLASPVYAGQIRPPLVRFIKRSDLSVIPCFLLLTGSVKSQEQADIERARTHIVESHGSIRAGIKMTVGERTRPEEFTRRLEQFAKDIASDLA